jgi:biopolymer transport protein ExbB/TolQ
MEKWRDRKESDYELPSEHEELAKMRNRFSQKVNTSLSSEETDWIVLLTKTVLIVKRHLSTIVLALLILQVVAIMALHRQNMRLEGRISRLEGRISVVEKALSKRHILLPEEEKKTEGNSKREQNLQERADRQNESINQRESPDSPGQDATP